VSTTPVISVYWRLMTMIWKIAVLGLEPMTYGSESEYASHYTTATLNRVRKSSNSFVKYTQILCSTPRNDSGARDTLAVVWLPCRLIVETGNWALRAELIEITFHLVGLHELYYTIIDWWDVISSAWVVVVKQYRFKCSIIIDRAIIRVLYTGL